MSDTNKHTHFTNTSPLVWWQKRAVTITIAVLGLVGVLIFINMNVVKYEAHLASGDPVLLQLAPVDPRGFMQGDYMALSYVLENDILDTLDKTRDRDKAADGYVIIALDEHNVGHFVRLADSKQPKTLKADERSIHYRLRDSSVKLATNAFFFQEGHADAFEAAKYGLFRVNDKGYPLLTNLVNETFEVINPEKPSKVQIDSQSNEKSAAL